MILEFATKTAKKPKCSKGYSCGGGCISRGFNCRKKLTGQGKNYADWLKNSPVKGGALAVVSKSNNSSSNGRLLRSSTPFALPPGKEQAKRFSKTDPNNFDKDGKYTTEAKVHELIERNVVMVPGSRKDKDIILKTPESARKYLTDTYNKEYDSLPQWAKNNEGRKLDLSDDNDLNAFYQRKIGEAPKPKKAVTSTNKRKTKINPSTVNGVNLASEANAKKASPWKVFGLNKNNATKAQVKRAFGDLALKHHPDQGGDPRAMRTLIALKDRALANFGEAPGEWDWVTEYQEDISLYNIFNARSPN